MSRSVLIGLLRKGKTGNEVLAILDAICNNEQVEDKKTYGTLEPLTFWEVGVANS